MYWGTRIRCTVQECVASFWKNLEKRFLSCVLRVNIYGIAFTTLRVLELPCMCEEPPSGRAKTIFATKFVCFVVSVLGCANLLIVLVVKCAAMHSSKGSHFSCPCLFVCESVVESPVQFLSAYVHVQSYIHFPNAVSASEGSIKAVRILSKAGRQRQCAPCSSPHKILPECGFCFFTYGQQSLNCELQKEWIYVSYKRGSLCFLFVVMNSVPWNQCI